MVLAREADKDLYGFAGPWTKFTYSCSARQNTDEFVQPIFGLRGPTFKSSAGRVSLDGANQSNVFPICIIIAIIYYICMARHR